MRERHRTSARGWGWVVVVAGVKPDLKIAMAPPASERARVLRTSVARLRHGIAHWVREFTSASASANG